MVRSLLRPVVDAQLAINEEGTFYTLNPAARETTLVVIHRQHDRKPRSQNRVLIGEGIEDLSVGDYLNWIRTTYGPKGVRFRDSFDKEWTYKVLGTYDRQIDKGYGTLPNADLFVYKGLVRLD